MFGKFAVCLVLAVCVLQGQARIIETKSYEKGIDDIIKVIEELINKIQKVISDITSNLPQFIKDLEEKIKQIISGLNLQEIVQKIIEQIKKIIGDAGAKVKECIEQQRDAIMKLAEEEQAGAQACVDAAKTQVSSLKEEITNLLNRANEIRKDVTDRVAKCINDNGLNPAGLYECLKAQVEPIKGELEQLEKEVAVLVAKAKEVAQQAAADLSACMNKLAADLSVKEQAIIEEIKKCVVG